MDDLFPLPQPMDTSHIKRKWLDIPYADKSDAQKLDIYLPNKGDGPFPVIATFHGGAWMFGDKGDDMNLPFLRRVETRLCGGLRQLPVERRGAFSEPNL